MQIFSNASNTGTCVLGVAGWAYNSFEYQLGIFFKYNLVV